MRRRGGPHVVTAFGPGGPLTALLLAVDSPGGPLSGGDHRKRESPRYVVHVFFTHVRYPLSHLKLHV